MAFVRALQKMCLMGGCLLACALELGATGCISATNSADDDSAGSSGSGGSGSGGSGSGGSGGGNTLPSCGQACQDYLVSYGLNDTMWFLWNQLVAGRPSGTKDESGACPLGGSVHITGTTSVSDNGIDVVDVAFALTSCENADNVYSLSYTGTVTMQGTFDSNSDVLAITFSSSSLVATGTLHYYDDPIIDDACPVNFAQSGAGDDWTLVGKVCGRSFNSETALPTSSNPSGGSGGSTSSGGTGATGGSGNSCQCFCPDGTDCTGASTPNPCGVDADGIPEACGCPVDCR
jgi:hypothetical protein